MCNLAFDAREQQRQIALKPQLYSAAACEPGLYKRKRTPICLRNDFASENLYASIRNESLRYFQDRRIPWHSVGHLTSSQACCVNLVFPFMNCPDLLKCVLQEIGYQVEDVLPFELDDLATLRAAGWTLCASTLDEHAITPHYIAFEWIGAKNYLGELTGRNVSGDTTRTRGQNFTSVDFAVRFRRPDKKIQTVLAEWKYTEAYTKARSKKLSKTGTNRLDRIYRRSLDAPGCQIQMPEGIPFEALFFNPFDQMMRQQLLASAMEQSREMNSDIVSYLHIAPLVNTELVNDVTSESLERLGDTIYDVWNELVPNERFQNCYLENFLQIAIDHRPSDAWAEFVETRYGAMH